VEYTIALPNASPMLEIDRINNDGHYERGNLRFVTRAENVNNRRNTSMVVTPEGGIPAAQWKGPYSVAIVNRYVRMGMTGAQIIDMARAAVREKRKNWRGILQRLTELGYMT